MAGLNKQPDTTPLNPALLGTGVKNPPTLQEFTQLEKEALKLDDAATIARYETAVLDKYFPQFTYNGAPRYIVQVRENLDDGTRVKEAVEKSLSDPESLTKKFNRAQGNRYEGFDLNTYMKRQSLAVAQKNKSLAGYMSAYYHSAYGADKAFFAAVNFTQEGCPSCKDNKKTLDCTKELHPLDHRSQQISRFYTAEHETAHAISFLSGTYKTRAKVSTDGDWLIHAEENAANAYAMLRIISKFGTEGMGYVKFYRGQHARQMNADKAQMDYQGHLDHWPILTLNNIIARYDDHPELLKDKTPPELFALAQQLIRPLSPAAIAELRAVDFKDLKKEDAADVKFNALAGKAKEPDANLFLNYQAGKEKRAEIFGIDEKMLAQLKKMPHMPSSWGKPLKDYSDKDLIDMALFDAAQRQGSSCPAAGYPERFKKTYGADDALVARVKGLVPPHLK